MKLFQKKEIFKVKSMPLDPASLPQPTTVAEFNKRGMAYYARKDYPAAIQDLEAALAKEPQNIDTLYNLGMVYKAHKLTDKAVEVFTTAIGLLESGVIADKSRTEMLRRLALGHINEIKQGDWNLEKEIWHRV